MNEDEYPELRTLAGTSHESCAIGRAINRKRGEHKCPNRAVPGSILCVPHRNEAYGRSSLPRPVPGA